MSLTLGIRAGKGSAMWPLSRSCIDDLQCLAKGGYKQAVSLLAGEENTEIGVERFVNRERLFDAVEQLLPQARKLPGGFQSRFRLPLGNHPEIYGEGGLSGILIDGIHFNLDCEQNYWTIHPTLGIKPSQQDMIPIGMRGEHRQEPAEIRTDNMGVIKIEIKEGKRSDLTRLLSEVKKFIAGIENDMVSIIVG